LSIVMGRRRRRLEEEIVPGEGWEIAMEPQGQCDGAYESVCAHSPQEECFLMGHHDQRGAIVGCEWSGWLVMDLADLQEGIIVLKIQTWHIESENQKTRRWGSVNGKRRLNTRVETVDDTIYYMGDLAYPEMQYLNETDHRRLRMRDYSTPALPDEFFFDFAINGKITSLNNTEFLALKKDPARVVEFLTLLDDQSFAEKGTVQLAIRLRGVARTMFFGLSHVYWA